jgi:hypothetical protein
LFSRVADRQMPCRVEGCAQTWTWSGIEQMRGLGEPPPQRMCDAHLAELNQLEDREVPCRAPGCSNTWTWKRGAQLHLLQKTTVLEPPARLCAECFEAERSLADTQISCRVGGCPNTWTWTRDAQLKHRAWLRRLAARSEPDGAAAPAEPAAAPEEATEGVEPEPSEPPVGTEDGGRRKKKRRRRRKLPEGPPERMCESCAAKLAGLSPQPQRCKVHGCVREWIWPRDHQLRAWVALGSAAGDTVPPAPRRMCDACRDFCKAHPDRAVRCGRPGCDLTWTWKTGAQLQAHLAGRFAEPIRLCDTCARGEFLLTQSPRPTTPGAEAMPCVVRGCSGTWIFSRGMALAPAREGDEPPDRMCDGCRTGRGLPARGSLEGEPTAPESTAGG